MRTKKNNNVDNLEWCTYSYNNSYNDKAKKAGKKAGEKLAKKVGQYSKDGQLIKIWKSLHDAERNGFHVGHICSCCQGKRKTHHVFKWKYIE